MRKKDPDYSYWYDNFVSPLTEQATLAYDAAAKTFDADEKTTFTVDGAKNDIYYATLLNQPHLYVFKEVPAMPATPEITYFWDYDEDYESAELDFNIPTVDVNGDLLAEEVPLELPAVEGKGAYPYTVTITQVNGHANEDAATTATGQLYAYTTLPVHRAVLEEYTGTWCGYCPRGFVGLEEMNRLFPADFIGIADEAPVRVTDHDLSGRRVTLPHGGLYLRTETLPSGAVRTRKVSR